MCVWILHRINFCVWCKEEPNFILSHTGERINPVIPACFAEKTNLSPLNCFGTRVKNQLTINIRVYVSTFNSILFICGFVLMPVPYCLGYCSFVVNFEIRNCECSSFFFFQDLFSWYSWSLVFPYEFYDQLVNFFKKASWDFDRNYIDL